MVQVTNSTSLAVDVPQGRKLFIFDRVFDEDVTQEGVWEYLQESVGSFVQGYNVSILAYGQSGAGKSYTMGTSGPREQNDSRIMGKSQPVMEAFRARKNNTETGIIPRAAALLFEKLTGSGDPSRKSTGIKTPNRYSIASMNNALQSMSRGNGDQNWTLKATYVEVISEH